MDKKQVSRIDTILSMINKSVFGIQDNDLIQKLKKNSNSYFKELYYINLDSIIEMLVEDGHITSTKGKMIDFSGNHLYDFYLLRTTIKGRSFCEKGGYKNHIRLSFWEDFPKKFWWVIAIFAWSVGMLTDFIKEKYKPSYQNLSIQQLKEFQSYVDSLESRKTLHDTIYLPFDSSNKGLKPSH